MQNGGVGALLGGDEGVTEDPEGRGERGGRHCLVIGRPARPRVAVVRAGVGGDLNPGVQADGVEERQVGRKRLHLIGFADADEQRPCQPLAVR